MAHCRKEWSVNKQYEYELTLSWEEADFLHRLLGNHIVGFSTGPRGYNNAIFDALDKHCAVHDLGKKGPLKVRQEQDDVRDRLFLLCDPQPQQSGED